MPLGILAAKHPRENHKTPRTRKRRPFLLLLQLLLLIKLNIVPTVKGEMVTESRSSITKQDREGAFGAERQYIYKFIVGYAIPKYQ